MTQEEAFSKILDSDETIVESFRPNKFRSTIINIIRDILVSLIITGVGVGLLYLSYSGLKDDAGRVMAKEPGWIFIGIGLFLLVISIISRIIRYTKCWYCYTNKRIILRSGFIGVDYKTLDYNGIAAIDVRVDLLDKFVKPNTGSIIFGSASAPIVNFSSGSATKNGSNSGYIFAYINDPYDVYKRIKQYIAEKK